MSKEAPTPISAPLDGGLLIEASAGTGKTHTLTTLAARLVVEAGHGIGDLLIVTFTVAATGELRTRIWQPCTRRAPPCALTRRPAAARRASLPPTGGAPESTTPSRG